MSTISSKIKSPAPTVVETTQNGKMQQMANTVILSSQGFSPSPLTVSVGTKVVWVNNSGEDAAIESDPHPTHTNYPPLNLGPVSNGESVELIFDTAGSYGYHNHLTPNEKGTIVVK